MAKLKHIDKFPSGSRLTSQRRIILDYLRSVYTHPTAEVIYKEVKKKLPQISFGTVYRNLNFLSDHDFILELKSTNGRAHYDGNPVDHIHFICLRCDKICDLQNNELEKLRANCLKKLQKTSSIGEIKHFRAILYGICKNCKNS